MKKLLLVLAIGSFVACNNSSETTEPKGDSATVDTVVKPIDTTMHPVDTTKKKATDTSAKAKK